MNDQQLTEKVRDLQLDNRFQHFIFNISELEQKMVKRIEEWGWSRSHLNILEEKEIRIDDPDPRNHRRKVRLRSSNEWKEDKKERRELGRNYFHSATNIIEVWEAASKCYNISPNLQNLIYQTALQPRHPANLAELQTKIQSVCFVRGVGYNPSKPWFLFDKQWLYEQILAPNPDDDFFIIQGTNPRKFENKNDAELKTFLQQLGELPTNTPTNNYSSDGSLGTQPSFQSYSQNASSEIPNQHSSTDYSSNSSSTNYNYSQDNPTTEQKISKETKDEKINFETNNALNSEKLEKIKGEESPNNFSLLVERSEENGLKEINTVTENPSNSEQINQPLTLFKQEVINQIKDQLVQNLDLKDLVDRKNSNWEQEIEKLISQKEVLAYQATLLQTIKNEQNLKSARKEASFEPKAKTNNITALIIASVFLLSIFLGYLFWKKSPKK